MSHIVYDSLNTIGGSMAASYISKFIALKDEGDRIMSLLKETTNDGNNCELIELPSGAHAPIFGVEAGSGATLRGAIYACTAAMNVVSDDTLANVDQGG